MNFRVLRKRTGKYIARGELVDDIGPVYRYVHETVDVLQYYQLRADELGNVLGIGEWIDIPVVLEENDQR